MTSSSPSDYQTLLRVENLTKIFPGKRKFFWKKPERGVCALGGVSFEIKKGETLGLVGESGCGKSTLGRCILRLAEPTSGSVRYRGAELLGLEASEMRLMRRKMQMIFQDPYSSLNPRLTVERILSEPLEIHRLHEGKTARKKRVLQLMERCGLRPEMLNRYPHEFSGGQRQRICIARALAVEPEFIICDEPVSALDVSIQAQIVNLLKDLQRDLGLTYLFIAHDLNIVEHISDQVAVMYFGRIVEQASKNRLFSAPAHPYTRALLSAIPVADLSVRGRNRATPLGEPPSPLDPPSGCAFHPRCPKAEERCRTDAPPIIQWKDGGAAQRQGPDLSGEASSCTLVRCHFPVAHT